MNTQLKSPIEQLQETIKELPMDDRWFLLKWLIELLQPQVNNPQGQPETLNQYPNPSFYGCIQDDTFFRHDQGTQADREVIV
ncbi:MAG: hypothetical protein ACO3NK_07430 [Prochlorotrichaceae cyanobacterium]|jgi:hypothetical protein